MMVNYYELLGVPVSASAEEIKAAYTRAMRKEHPDMGGSEQSAQLLNEAQRVLLDERRRAEYDATLERQQRRIVVIKPSSDPVSTFTGERGSAGDVLAQDQDVAEGPDVAGAAFGVAYEGARAVFSWGRWVRRLLLWFIVLPVLVFAVVLPVGDGLVASGFAGAGDVVKVAGIVLLYGVPASFWWARYRRQNVVRQGAGLRVRRVNDEGNVELFSVQRG